MPLPDPENLLFEWTSHFRHFGFDGARSESLARQVRDFIFANEPLMLPRELSPEEKADARDIFEGKVKDRQACLHCAGLHPQVAGLVPEQQPCPRIKRIKRHTDATTILDVEYWPNGEWESDVVFPGDVYEDSDQ
jgi:hypothetical protein